MDCDTRRIRVSLAVRFLGKLHDVHLLGPSSLGQCFKWTAGFLCLSNRKECTCMAAARNGPDINDRTDIKMQGWTWVGVTSTLPGLQVVRHGSFVFCDCSVTSGAEGVR